MTLVLVMAFNTFVALALGFVLGRIYQIRSDPIQTTQRFRATADCPHSAPYAAPCLGSSFIERRWRGRARGAQPSGNRGQSGELWQRRWWRSGMG